MEVTVTASTGASIVIWPEGDMLGARRVESGEEPQICLGVDLFEVIAELADLDLDTAADAQEAVDLATSAQRRLSSTRSLESGSSTAAERGDQGLADDG